MDGKGGVKEIQQYDVDEYICPSVTKYTPEFLLQHHFRDFGEAEGEADRDYARAPAPPAGREGLALCGAAAAAPEGRLRYPVRIGLRVAGRGLSRS